MKSAVFIVDRLLMELAQEALIGFMSMGMEAINAFFAAQRLPEVVLEVLMENTKNSKLANDIIQDLTQYSGWIFKIKKIVGEK